MKGIILPLVLLMTVMASAQRSGVYAITDLTAGGAAWLNIREVSVTGSEGKLLLSNNTFAGSRVDLQTQQKTSVSVNGISSQKDLPLNSGVAALAYDNVHNRLYFSTMFNGDIRYISLNKGDDSYYQVGVVYDAIPLPNNVPLSSTNQGPVVTRMTFGADNYIYGLSNNGDAFFRVSTNSKKPVIEALGTLSDDPANGAMSVHASCSSWGGDMVASADGSLYLFSMYQQVFKINPATKVATYLGKIQGLPAEFTVNGAAVQDDGSILLSSATMAGKVGVITNPNELNAMVKESDKWLNTSDLASGNMLFSKKEDVVFAEFNRTINHSGVGVYPNPVNNGQIIVHFKEGLTGNHSLDLLDIAGGSKMQSFVTLNGQAQRVSLRTGTLSQGIYLLRVTNSQKREVETIKVMIQ